MVAPVTASRSVLTVETANSRSICCASDANAVTASAVPSTVTASGTTVKFEDVMDASVLPNHGDFGSTVVVGVAPGYGVEIGLLFDTYDRLGLDGLAQVNLGVRKHRNRSLLQLGAMARQILGAALRRCGPADSGAPLTQFLQVGG